jgi:hypothetical protein
MRRTTLLALSLLAALGIAGYSPTASAAFRYTESSTSCPKPDYRANESLTYDDTRETNSYRRNYDQACCVKRTPDMQLNALNADCPVGYVRIR